jgi:pantothenate kinase type III
MEQAGPVIGASRAFNSRSFVKKSLIQSVVKSNSFILIAVAANVFSVNKKVIIHKTGKPPICIQSGALFIFGATSHIKESPYVRIFSF